MVGSSRSVLAEVRALGERPLREPARGAGGRALLRAPLRPREHERGSLGRGAGEVPRGGLRGRAAPRERRVPRAQGHGRGAHRLRGAHRGGPGQPPGRARPTRPG